MSDTLLVDDLRVIDTDTHVSEPPDLWTSRVPAKWRDEVPHVELNPGRATSTGASATRGSWASASTPSPGWKEFPPDTPRQLEDDGVDPGAWDPTERLRRMDEYGIHAQVLYPNLIGFESPLFMRLGAELSLACVHGLQRLPRRVRRGRPEAAHPDRHGAVLGPGRRRRGDGQRCTGLGHRGILFANKYEMIGLPPFTDPHWDRDLRRRPGPRAVGQLPRRVLVEHGRAPPPP